METKTSLNEDVSTTHLASAEAAETLADSTNTKVDKAVEGSGLRAFFGFGSRLNNYTEGFTFEKEPNTFVVDIIPMRGWNCKLRVFTADKVQIGEYHPRGFLAKFGPVIVYPPKNQTWDSIREADKSSVQT